MARDDFLYVEVLGDRNLLRNLDQMPDVVREILVVKVTQWTKQLEHRCRKHPLSPEAKDPVSCVGLDSEVIEDGKRVEGRVFIHGVPMPRPKKKVAVRSSHDLSRQGEDPSLLWFHRAEGVCHSCFSSRRSYPRILTS
jgi:hypothetical protein